MNVPPLVVTVELLMLTEPDVLVDACRLTFNAPPDRPCRIFVDDGRDLFGGGIETITIPTCDQYTIQGDLFSRAILEDGPVAYPLEDTVANMRVIDAVFRSAEAGEWIRLGG